MRKKLLCSSIASVVVFMFFPVFQMLDVSADDKTASKLDNLYNEKKDKEEQQKLDLMIKKLYGEDKPAAEKPKKDSAQLKKESAAREYYPSEVFKLTRESVVIVVNPQGWGSGFGIRGNGYIITNKHVVCDMKTGTPFSKIAVTHPDWNREVRMAKIIQISKDKDLALIKIEKSLPRTLQLGQTKTLLVGDKVFALGNPGSGAPDEVGPILTLTFTEGIVSGKDRQCLGNNCLQTTATINPGNSGGPLLDENAFVVGVNTFGLTGLENTFFAITVEEIKKEFKKYTMSDE